MVEKLKLLFNHFIMMYNITEFLKKGGKGCLTDYSVKKKSRQQ